MSAPPFQVPGFANLDVGRLNAASRADLIYRTARAQVERGLWDVALGTQANSEVSNERQSGVEDLLRAAASPRLSTAMASHMALLLGTADDAATSSALAPAVPKPAVVQGAQKTSLGANIKYSGILQSASARTGMPAEALAAVVHAEAAKRPDGSWDTASRNPRSSAVGLGQFLAQTWVGEAERTGTFLHQLAGDRGWLDAAGRVQVQARSALLSLRYDAKTAIEATADFAVDNFARLRRAGLSLGQSAEDVAKTAWLSHHLGSGDAARFLNGTLSSDRARTLLEAQIGSTAASLRIARIGEAAAAHREWLSSFMERNVRLPDFFS